jgi:dTDP-L-rhamnose 4-epimerase
MRVLSGASAGALSTLHLVKHVLVTGGAGFIGSHIVDDLVDRGVMVTVLDNLDPAAHSELPTYLNAAVRYVWGDVRSAEAWREALVGVDAVCHQAGKVGLGVSFDDADEYVTNNVNGWMAGLRVLHEQAFTGTIVLASSMVVYGEGRYRCAAHGIVRPATRRAADLDAGNFECPCPQCGDALLAEAIPEDAPLEPRNVYAATKLSQEHLLESFAREHELAAVALRYHNVYGPRMPRDTPYAGVASIFRSALAGGRAPNVTEDGNQMRNFVHVRDVAAANVAALGFAGAPGVVRAFNVASPTPRSVGDMARSLASAFGSSAGDDLWPVVTGGYRNGDVRHVFASAERARHELGFVGTVGFADGMAEFSTAQLRAPVNVGSHV